MGDVVASRTGADEEGVHGGESAEDLPGPIAGAVIGTELLAGERSEEARDRARGAALQREARRQQVARDVPRQTRAEEDGVNRRGPTRSASGSRRPERRRRWRAGEAR
jgi:hypothetical protein